MQNRFISSFVLIFFTSLLIFRHEFTAPAQANYVQYASTDPGLTNIGYAAFNLTAKNFNCDGFFEATKKLKELHVAFLFNTFGNNFSCLERLLQDDRLKTLEINLINEPGHRNGRLGSYEFLYGIGTPRQFNELMKKKNPALRKKFLKYVSPIKTFLTKNLRPETSLLINPGLESNLSDAAGKILVRWSRQEFPDARIVWNPLFANNDRRKAAQADFIEGHGLFPRISGPCVYNLDGTDVSYPYRPALGQLSFQEGGMKNWVQSGPPLWQLLEDYANKCEVVFLWTAEGNGLDYRTGGFVDPRKRNNHISTEMYKTIVNDIYYMHRKGKIYPHTYSYTEEENFPMKQCSEVRYGFADGARYGNLLKQSEFRDRGGVIILNPEYNNVGQIKIVHGLTVVDTYNHQGAYKDGRVLFRSSRSPVTYPFNTFMTFLHGSRQICYKIPNPRVRLD